MCFFQDFIYHARAHDPNTQNKISDSRAVHRVVIAWGPGNVRILQDFICLPGRETLESVSSCTRFSCILKISNFGFNRSSSKLVGMFVGIVLMFVLRDFVQDCFVAQICAKMCVRAVIRAYLRDEAIRNKILGYEHWNYPKEHAYQF